MAAPEIDITGDELKDILVSSKLGPDALTSYADLRLSHQLDHLTAKGFMEHNVTNEDIVAALEVELKYEQMFDLCRQGKSVQIILAFMKAGATLPEALEAHDADLQSYLDWRYAKLRKSIGHRQILEISRAIRDAGVDDINPLRPAGNGVFELIFDRGLSPQQAIEVTLAGGWVKDYCKAADAGITHEEFLEAWGACKVRRRIWAYIDKRANGGRHLESIMQAQRLR